MALKYRGGGEEEVLKEEPTNKYTNKDNSTRI
jgi:hypothetical protein